MPCAFLGLLCVKNYILFVCTLLLDCLLKFALLIWAGLSREGVPFSFWIYFLLFMLDRELGYFDVFLFSFSFGRLVSFYY